MNQEIEQPRIKPVSTRPLKRIRLVCNDPDATDSSDDEHVAHNKLKRVCFDIEDLNRAPECEDSVQDSSNGEKNPSTAVEASNAYKMKRMESVALTKSDDLCPEKKVSNYPYVESKVGLVAAKYTGVRQRKLGRWTAEIREPISHKNVWLGTFNTAEEASHAYQTTRMEFDAMTNGVQQRTCGKCAVVIRNPISHQNVCLGKYSTAEEQASHAFQMKKLEFDALTNSVDLSSEWSSHNVVKHIEKPKVILSNGSRGSAFSVNSYTFPSSDNTCQENPKKNKGVQLHKSGRWEAYVYDRKKKVWLGTYDTAEEASNAYRMKRMELDTLTKSVNFSSKKRSKPKACLSSISRERAFILTSHASPSSMLIMDSSGVSNRKHEDAHANSSSIQAGNANEPTKAVDSEILDEDLIALAGDIEAEMEMDFAKAFKDIPLYVDDNNSELPDFDFDFESDDSTDDEPIP